MVHATNWHTPELPFTRLNPRVRVLWLVLWALETAAVVALLAAAPLLAVLTGRRFAGWLVLAVTLASLLYAMLALARVQLRYRRTGYRLAAQTLDLAVGVWWRCETTTPYFRVQHVDVAQGPLERLLGLSKLVVHTASARQRMTIPGMDASEVDALRDQILANIGRDDAV